MPTTSDTNVTNESTRRHFIWKGLLAVAAGLFGRRAFAEDAAKPSTLEMEGDVMHTNVYKGRPPLEPLDTMIRFERSDDNNGRAMTHEILSLMHEEKGKKSYPWTIYAGLSTHHEEGDACVMCARLHKEGKGWSTGLHSEVFNNSTDVGIGMNIEMTNNHYVPGKNLLVGLNVQICGTNPCQYGIQVHGPAPCDKGIGLNGIGKAGLDVAGKYETGIHAHGNSIRLDEGACIELDGKGQVKMRYLKGRIEFLNGDRCVGHLNMDGADHEV